jgi:branched-chain amino acid transport system ATP-binding protein
LSLLELHSVSKSFGGLKVLNDLSLSVKQGEALGILGPNGAGKTTLLNLIAGEFAPTAGHIFFDGVDVTRLPAHRRCQAGIGRTYQIPRPFTGLTVFENVLVAATHSQNKSERASHALCGAVLNETGLFAKRAVLAGDLRLLDRKRLELARALATQPKLILLDEIGGGLTENEVHELLDEIRALRTRGLTIIWIEHIVHALASVVDRIVAINFGEMLIEGQPQAVLASKALQEIYLGVE